MSDAGSKLINFPIKESPSTPNNNLHIVERPPIPPNEGMSLNVLNVFMPILYKILESEFVFILDLEFDVLSKLNSQLSMKSALRYMEEDIDGKLCYKYSSTRKSKGGEVLELWLKFDIDRNSISESYIGYRNDRNQTNRFRILFAEKVEGYSDIESFRLSHPSILESSKVFNATIEKERIERFNYRFRFTQQLDEQHSRTIEARRTFMNLGDFEFAGKDYTVYVHNSELHERAREVPRNSVINQGLDMES